MTSPLQRVILASAGGYFGAVHSLRQVHKQDDRGAIHADSLAMDESRQG